MKKIFFFTGYTHNKTRIVLVGLAILLVLIGSFYLKKRNPVSEILPQEIVSDVITLTPAEEARLLQQMTPLPDAKPTLSDKKLETLVENMSAPKGAKPSLSEDELQKLLQSMTPE